MYARARLFITRVRSARSPLHDVRQQAQLQSSTGVAQERSNGRDDQPAGGARRNRTDDLLLAKQALSQLSYGPANQWPPLKLRHDSLRKQRLAKP